MSIVTTGKLAGLVGPMQVMRSKHPRLACVRTCGAWVVKVLP